MLDQDEHFKSITDYLYSISVEMGFRLYVLQKPKNNNTYLRHRIEIDRYKTKDQFIAILYDRMVKDRKPHFSQIHTRWTSISNSLRCNTFNYIIEFEGLNDQVELQINDVINIYEHTPQIPPLIMNTILPDNSACFTASFPLPKDHWIYKPTEYEVGKEYPIDRPEPILTRALSDQVIAAAKYAIRASTINGREKDFDPDAMVLNMLNALCGQRTLVTYIRNQSEDDVRVQDTDLTQNNSTHVAQDDEQDSPPLNVELYKDENAKVAVDIILNNTKYTEAQKRDSLIRLVATWIESAAHFCKGQEFYQNIVVDIGKKFGDAAKLCDDGNLSDDVLALRVPELVDKLQKDHQDLQDKIANALT